MDKPIEQMSDRELQRAIAELRGWDVVQHGDLWCGVHPGRGLVPFSKEIVNNRQVAWNLMFADYIPNWPQDTHAAAVDLLAEMPGWVLYYSGGFPVFWVVKGNAEDYEIPEDCPTINHTYPARAISEAWLAWKRGKDGR